jgi:hypothetical protein
MYELVVRTRESSNQYPNEISASGLPSANSLDRYARRRLPAFSWSVRVPLLIPLAASWRCHGKTPPHSECCHRSKFDQIPRQTCNTTHTHTTPSNLFIQWLVLSQPDVVDTSDMAQPLPGASPGEDDLYATSALDVRAESHRGTRNRTSTMLHRLASAVMPERER